MNPPTVGNHAEFTRQVEADDTAIALRSGDVDVLGTPRLIAWLEAATVLIVGSSAESTTVGTRVEIDHLAPSPRGTEVTVRAELVDVAGRTLTFSADAAHSDGRIVAKARIVRVVVDRQSFARPD